MLDRVVAARLAYLRRNRCCLLVIALCLFILVSPLLVGTIMGILVLMILLMGLLVLATWALRARRLVLTTAGGLALLTSLLLIAHRTVDYGLQPVAQGVSALFLGAVTIALLAYVLDEHLISADKVYGAVAAYVLIAFTFASIFGLLLAFQPNAFYAAEVNNPDGILTWSDLMYFSFTVLTSTGFGEITPVTGMARSLIVIEQVLGVMYVAFLIARLANLYGRSERR